MQCRFLARERRYKLILTFVPPLAADCVHTVPITILQLSQELEAKGKKVVCLLK